jgi:hypothetical protein
LSFFGIHRALGCSESSILDHANRIFPGIDLKQQLVFQLSCSVVIKKNRIGQKANENELEIVDDLRGFLDFSDDKGTVFFCFELERIVLIAWLEHVYESRYQP